MDHEGVHATHVVEEIRSARQIALQDDFGVAFGLEDDALGLQFRAERAIIVEFPIVDDGRAGLCIDQRLVGLIGDIDDRQARVHQADAVVGAEQGPLPVRAPAGDRPGKLSCASLGFHRGAVRRSNPSSQTTHNFPGDPVIA